MTTPQPRPNVAEIPPYVAGKPPTVRPGMTSYKLSSNENPYPPLPGVVEAVQAGVGAMNRYPDMGSVALYEALSQKFGVPVEHLSVATGSVGLIYQLVQAFCDPGDEVVFAWRSFEAYPIAVAAAAATAVKVPVTADGRHDLDAMAAAITDRTKVVLVCTPNNPTGPAVSQAELDAFLADAPRHYERYIVQSLIGNHKWSSRSSQGRLYHVGTIPNRKGEAYVADLRMMVSGGPEGFRPLVIYARRARTPLVDELVPGSPSWDILGTNLSIKLADGSFDSDHARLLLMDRKDFNTLGLGIDDLIEAYIQTVMATTAIDRMATALTSSKGKLKTKLFRSLDDDAVLAEEIMR